MHKHVIWSGAGAAPRARRCQARVLLRCGRWAAGAFGRADECGIQCMHCTHSIHHDISAACETDLSRSKQ